MNIYIYFLVFWLTAMHIFCKFVEYLMSCGVLWCCSKFCLLLAYTNKIYLKFLTSSPETLLNPSSLGFRFPQRAYRGRWDSVFLWSSHYILIACTASLSCRARGQCGGQPGLITVSQETRLCCLWPARRLQEASLITLFTRSRVFFYLLLA